MNRRSLLLAVGIFALLVCTTGASLCLLVRYEPKPYVLAEVPAGESRYQKSQEFTMEFSQLVSAIANRPDAPESWDARFTDEQINSYFAEGFVTSGLEEKVLAEGISHPRVVIDSDKVRLAFRYGSGFWSTVVSIDVKAWVAKDEPNVVALQLVGFHAGALPMSAQALYERFSDLGRQYGIDVTWYRYEGYPVALLRFQPDKPNPTLELQAVHLEKGAITIQGRCTDGATVGALLPLPGSAKPASD
jgi:hypothetical protein